MTTLARSDLRYVRAVGDAKITGYVGIWGSPRQTDCYGTYFDRQRPPDFGLVGKTPNVRLLYGHTSDDDIAFDIIGVITRMWEDETGIAFEAELFRDSPHFERVMREIRAGKLATSSASAEHLALFDDDGRFVKWYLTELSLTDKPCEFRMPKVKMIRSQDGGIHAVYEADDQRDAKDGSCSCGCGGKSDATTKVNTSNRGKQMTAPTAPNVRALLEELGLQPDADAMSVLAALVERDGLESVMQMLQSMQQPSAEPTLENPQRGTDPAKDEEPAPTRGDQLRSALEALLTTKPKPAAKRDEAGVQKLADQLRLLMMGDPTTNDKPTIPDGRPGNRITSVRDMQFDRATPEQLAMGYQIRMSRVPDFMRETVKPEQLVSEKYFRAMTYMTAHKLEAGDKNYVDAPFRSSFVTRDGRAIRANEVMGTAQSGFGSEWAEDLPGSTLWESVRNETQLYQMLISKGMTEEEIPRGYKSETIPLEGSDNTWYVAGQATDIDTSSGMVTPTFSPSKLGTAEKQITIAKLSTWMPYTNEETEDSLIDFAAETLRKIRVTAPEQIEYILMNGDTAAGANTNINLIDGTPAAAPAKPSYTLMDGFLKRALVTNTANSRLSNVPFSEVDFLATIQLLPVAYRNQKQRLLFFIDGDTGLQAVNIPSVKTKDVFTAAAIEEGELIRIYKVDILQSGFMAAANAVGKISSTAGNNIYGRIGVVRPDRVKMRWKRRLQVATIYNEIADAYSTVAHMRLGMGFFDTEATAVTYGIPLTLV